METQDYLVELARVNRHGFGFLLGYGTTWLIAAALSHRLGERVGTYAALFQGMVGLPFSLGLTAWAAAGPRPEDATLGPLSFYLSMGQLLVLPVAIVLVVHRRHVWAVSLLAVVLAVHFVPYAWLYDTPVYLVVGAVVAVGAAVLVAAPDEQGRQVTRICALTGTTLLLGGIVALLL